METAKVTREDDPEEKICVDPRAIYDYSFSDVNLKTNSKERKTMNSKLRRTSSLVIVLLLVGALVQHFAGNAAAQSNREGWLQGTWRLHVNPRNCQTGAPIPPFETLVSFARGGTLTEVTTAPFLPGQITTGLGVWSHTHDNAYKAVFDKFVLFDSPETATGFKFKRGMQRHIWEIVVEGDQIKIESSGQFLDTNGNLIAATCASSTGTPLGNAQDQD